MQSFKGERPNDPNWEFYQRKAYVMMKLTDKQIKFAYAWMVHRNDQKASIEAGYSGNALNAFQYRNKPHIREFIGILLEEKMRVYEITLNNIFKELAKIAFSNSFDYVSFTKDGDPFVDLSKVTPEQAAAIAELSVDDYVEGRGDDARDVKKVRVKLHDKRSALVDLAKLKMIVDADPTKYVLIDQKGDSNVERLSDTERRRRLARVLGLQKLGGIGQITDVDAEPAVDPESGTTDGST